MLAKNNLKVGTFRSDCCGEEAVRSILKQHNLPRNWWDFAAEHATNMLNIMPSDALSNKSPNYTWSGTIPDISDLKVFECLVYAHQDSKKLQKLAM